ncbi:DUF87 domain-containing protein [archaeon]|jgi:conjugal transfer ATP-binding protein TraC|nr:DUF87 domain-containing protein [archaeon]
MAYEIPSKLQYSEKIIFGLDFKQLLYAVVFGLLNFTIFFKLSWDIKVKISLALVPTFLAVGFMFFGLDKYLINIYHWLRFRKTNDVNKFIGVSKIDEYIHTKKRVAVIKVYPINFNIKAKDEKDTITRQFLHFMNAIDFPIQILMQTGEVNINEYLDKLKSPEKYSQLAAANKLFLQNILKERKIHDRSFYLVIPEKDNLDIQVELCKDWLRTLGLKHQVLGKKALEKLVLSKNKSLVNSPSHLKIDSEYHRTIYAHGYPRIVEQGFLDKIISCAGNFDFSFHVSPFNVETMILMINKELQKQKADLYSMGLKGMVNPSLEIQYQDTRRVLTELQKGTDKLFNISLYIDCKAGSLEDLNLITRKVESQLNALMIVPKTALFQMDHGYKSMLPLAEDKLKFSRNLTSHGLSAFFPWTSPFFQIDNDGVWLGLNKNGIPIIKDIFSLSNPNGVILAQSGGGKSYFAKLLISRYLLLGTKVMVIDPQGEYRAVVGSFGGERIDLSRTSNSIINPLDIMGHDYTEKRLALLDLIAVMLGDITEPQRAFIDRALTKTYEKKGITLDPDSWDNEPPILGDLLKVLEQMEKKASQLEKVSLRSLMNRLSIYVTGVFSFLNRHTNINFSNHFVCFDIGDIPKPIKPTIMFLVLDYVYSKMKKDLDRKILLIDEAWSLLSRTKDASYIFEIVKTCRKFNMGLLLINQEVEGLLTSAAGKSVLANSAYTVLLKQKPAVIRNITSTFHLSKYEQDYILGAPVGVGILIIDDEHHELKVVASPQEHKLITTKADELLQYRKESDVESPRKSKKKVDVKVDPAKRFFRKKKLSAAEVKFLIAKRYIEVTRKSIVSGKQETFLLKPRFNESESHLFVTFDIAEYLEKKGVPCKLYVTKKPDIVFEINGKKVAVEVETGSQSGKAARLKEKVKLLNKGYHHWFFVVTNRKFTQKYRKLGETIETRYLKKYLDKFIK